VHGTTTSASGSTDANLPPMEFDVNSTSVITRLASQTLADSQRTRDNDIVEEATGQEQYRLYRAAQNKQNRLPSHIIQGAVQSSHRTGSSSWTRKGC
jgi:hypothetical protein